MNRSRLKLCLVTNLGRQPLQSYRPLIVKAIQGGVTSVQLREKTENLSEFHELALQVKKILRPFNVPLIINDHVHIAKDIGAEGVHIGQSDLSPDEARKILGPSTIIGWSVETLEELEIANKLECLDYIAASAVFPSRTKPDCKTIWGIDGLRKITQLSRYPVMAIGGINLGNIGMIINSGACGAAVIGAIHNNDPRKSAAALIAEIEKAETNYVQERESLLSCTDRRYS